MSCALAQEDGGGAGGAVQARPSIPGQTPGDGVPVSGGEGRKLTIPKPGDLFGLPDSPRVPAEEKTAPEEGAKAEDARREDSAAGLLLEMVQSEDAATRLLGLEALGKEPGAVSEYLEWFLAALGDPDEDVRALAARLLAQGEGDEVCERVLGILCNGPPAAVPLVDAALPGLKGILEARMLATFQDGERTRDERWSAAYSLGRMKSLRALPYLAAGAWGEEPAVAVASARALVAFRDPVVAPELVRLSAHGNAEIRYAVIAGLGDIGGAEAAQALGAIMIGCTEGYEAVGEYALSVLCTFGQKEAVPVLIEVMRRNLRMRRSAVNGLCQLTGEDLGDLPSDWAQWYERTRLAAPQSEGGPAGPAPALIPAPPPAPLVEAPPMMYGDGEEDGED